MKNVKNNKGFSLVELIIVIAIMAVLIGILAPQYLKFVEKSRLSRDNDYIDSVRKAVESIAADPSYDLGTTEIVITFSDQNSPSLSNDPTIMTNGSNSISLSDAIDAIIDIKDATATPGTLASKTYASACNASPAAPPTITINFTTDADNDGINDPTVTTDNILGN